MDTRTRALWAALFLIAVRWTALWAEDALREPDPEEALFGEGALITEVGSGADGPGTPTGAAVPGQASARDGLLSTESVKIGGTFGMELKGEGEVQDLKPDTELWTELFADARPKESLRVFIKGRLAYPFAEASDFMVREAFADITPSNGVFLRAGKQTANWGVGYYFSPANLLSRSRINPQDPEAELEGPLAVKVHIPVSTRNYYAYALLDEADQGEAPGFAVKGEWVLAGGEYSLGALVQDGYPWALMATGSLTLWGFDLFAELSLRGGEDKLFIRNDPESPLGMSTERRCKELFPSGTLGFVRLWSGNGLPFSATATAQAYFNGLGYGDPSLIRREAAAVGALVASGELPLGDLAERDRWYGAAGLSLEDLFGTEFGLGFNWLASMEDPSGKIGADLIWDGLDSLRLTASYGYFYGPRGSEFAPAGAASQVALKASLRGTTF